MFKLAKRPPLEQPLTGRVIAESVAWSFLSWLLYGAALWLLAIRVGCPGRDRLPAAVGAFALGFALGFVFIPAPAGAASGMYVIIAILSHGDANVVTALAVDLVWRASPSSATSSSRPGHGQPPWPGRAPERGAESPIPNGGP